MERIKIPYGGSFQRGRLFRNGTPDAAAWKHIRRIGTLDNLRRIAARSNISTELAEIASLRIRQAIEFHDASTGASMLTRPLLLYYSALNLIRGALIARHGGTGAASHGMKYVRADNILECSAEIKKGGTFPHLVESVLGSNAPDTANQVLSLRDVIAQIPELLSEHRLAGISEPLIAAVSVDACFDSDVELKFHIEGISEEEFASNWKAILPWLAAECALAKPFTLVLTSRPTGEEEIAQFCYKYLWRDLQLRNDAVWFDQVSRPGSTLLPRPASYLAALFILSNVSRYEPETLMHLLEPTDLAYVVDSLLDCADRCIPLLVIELLEGPTYFA